MPTMLKRLSAPAVALLFLLMASPADSNSAHFAKDGCPTPSVSVFDLSVPPPNGHQDSDRQVLFVGGMEAFGVLFNKDPSASMIQYLDYQILSQHINVGSSSLPPEGPLSGVDYLVSGAITGSPGAYSVSIALEDAKTRTVIASGSANFAQVEQVDAAVEQAALQLTPMFEKIRDYQKKLREADRNVALLAEIAVAPERKRLNVGQSTPVKLQLKDCDGAPLEERTLKIKASGGTVSPSTVKTNAYGEARVTFNAGKRGPAQIKAYYGPYETAVHGSNMAGGVGLVDVDDPLTDRYVVTAQLSYNLTESGELNESSQLASVDAAANSSVKITEWGTGNPATGSFHLLAATTTGSYSMQETALQSDEIGSGDYCQAAAETEFASAQPTDGDVSITRAHRGYRVLADADFKAAETQASQAGSLCLSPGDTDVNVVAGRSVELQNVGAGWQGSCGGSSSHITCHVKRSYNTESNYAASDVAPTTVEGTIDVSIRQLRASETG